MEMRIEAYMVRTRGDARPLASHWADKLRAASNHDGTFRDPELEAEFQAWKAERDAKRAEETA